MCDLQQQGKWTSPGGNMKQFKGRGGETGGRKAGEERAGSGSSKRAGSGREMRNAQYFN